MYHACMPTFMLDELVGNDPSLTIKDLQLIFNVEYDFAVKDLLNTLITKICRNGIVHFYCIFNNRIGGV